MNRFIILVLFGLFFYQSAVAQEVMKIDKLTSGMNVTIKGEVTRILDEDEFRIKDSTGSVQVYIGWKNRMPDLLGKTVLVRGVVDDDLKARFRPEIYAYEMVLEDGTVITLNNREVSEVSEKSTQKAPSSMQTDTAKPAKAITPIGNLDRGMSVVISGKVTRILDEDEFRMEDATGSVRVYIGWRNRVTVAEGEHITVRGVVDDDLTAFFRPELYASEITREDGTVIKLN